MGWLCLAQTEEIVVAQGKLEPQGEVKDIQVPIGVVEEILVKEGEQVKAGQSCCAWIQKPRPIAIEPAALVSKKQLDLKLEEKRRAWS